MLHINQCKENPQKESLTSKEVKKAILKEYFRCETLDYYDCLKFGGIIVSAFCARNAELSMFDGLATKIGEMVAAHPTRKELSQIGSFFDAFGLNPMKHISEPDVLHGFTSQDLAKRNDYTLAAGEKMSSLILSADSIAEEQLIDENYNHSIVQPKKASSIGVWSWRIYLFLSGQPPKQYK